MYGKDIERIIKQITAINNEVATQISLLARESDYRLETIDHSHNATVTNAPHGHGSGDHTHSVPGVANPTGWNGSDGNVSRQLTYPAEYSVDEHSHPHDEASVIYEREHRVTAATYTAPIVALGNAFKAGDGAKMAGICSANFEGKGNFNNCYGSPWQEMEDLTDRIADVEAYAGAYPNLQWLGEKQSLLSLMQLVYTASVDAKWAIIIYHDYVQRGYDNRENDNKVSVMWDHFVRGQTDGNIDDVRGNHPGREQEPLERF